MENFLNRYTELQIFQNRLSHQDNIPEVLLLIAPTGFGKSRLTDELMAKSNRPSIRIEIPGYDTDKTEQGKFLRDISKQIDQQFGQNDKLISLNGFLKQFKKDDINQIYQQRLVNRTFDMSFLKNLTPIKEMIERRMGTSFWDTNRILNGSIAESSIILNGYLRSVLSYCTELVISVENIQQTDEESLEQLISLFGAPGHQSFFFLEYTGDVDIKFEKMCEKFSKAKGFNFMTYDLPPLSRKNFHRLVEKDPALHKSVVNYVYDQFRGNLRQGIDLNRLIKRSLDPQYINLEIGFDNPSLMAINSLSANEQKVLIAIATHHGSVECDEINRLHSFEGLGGKYINIDSSVEELKRSDLIYKERNTFKIAHDSITTTVLENFQSKTIIWFQFWADYYQDMLQKQDFAKYSQRSIISRLFYYYLRCRPRKLRALMPKIRELILTIGSVHAAKEFTRIIKGHCNVLPTEIQTGILFNLIDILYYVGFFDEAFEIWELISEQSIQSILYKLVLLNRLDQHEEVLKLSQELLKGKKRKAYSKQFILNICLIQFLSYRSLGKFQNCRKILNFIEKDSSFKRYEEFGFFLRNREIILSSQKAIPCLREAIKFFETRSIEDAARAKLTLAMHLAFMEKLEEAEQLTLEARDVLIHHGLEQHIIFNNLAVIKIFKEEKTEETYQILKIALTTAYVPFDKTTILANMLGLLVELQKYDEAENVVLDLLTLLPAQKDILLKQLVYFNLCFFYKKIEDNMRFNKYKKLLLKCVERIDGNWRYRLEGRSPQDRIQDYLNSYESHADFIVYWHFKISQL